MRIVDCGFQIAKCGVRIFSNLKLPIAGSSNDAHIKCAQDLKFEKIRNLQFAICNPQSAIGGGVSNV